MSTLLEHPVPGRVGAEIAQEWNHADPPHVTTRCDGSGLWRSFSFWCSQIVPEKWIDKNIVAEDWQWIGTLFLCGEQRNAANLIKGMKAAGLIVKAGEFERV